MPSIDIGGVRELLGAVVTAASILGGYMAFRSGLSALTAVAEEETPENVAPSINLGVAEGFMWGVPLSAIAFMIVL
jgi:hypothetical protein